jgi:hypothetical protein
VIARNEGIARIASLGSAARILSALDVVAVVKEEMNHKCWAGTECGAGVKRT